MLFSNELQFQTANSSKYLFQMVNLLGQPGKWIFFKTTAALICMVGKFGWNLQSFTNMFARYIILQKQKWPVMLSPGKSYDWPSWMASGSNYSMERAMLGKGCSRCCEYKTKFINCYRSLDVFRCHCITRMQWARARVTISECNIRGLTRLDHFWELSFMEKGQTIHNKSKKLKNGQSITTWFNKELV